MGGIVKRIAIVALVMLPVLYELPRASLHPAFERDFVNYWLSGRAIWAGVDPYNLDAFLAFAREQFPTILPEQANFTYPPHALFLFVPFGALPPTPSLILWSLLSIGFFWWAARPFVPKGLPTAVAVLSPAALINLRYGQTGLFSAGLFLVAFRPSGIAAALLTFKPQMGLLTIPALLGDRRALTTAIAATLALILLSAFAFPGGWPAFIDHAIRFQGAKLASGAEQPWMFLSTTPMAFYGWWGWLLYAAGAAWFLRRNFTVFTAATATFLVSPYGFHYDMAAVCLGFLILLHDRWDDMPVIHKAIAILVYLVPDLVDVGSWVVPPILLLGLAVQTHWMRPPALGKRGADGHNTVS